MYLNRIKNLLLLVILIAVSTAAFAGGGPKNPELRKELRAYMKQNIRPVLREQRLKLDKEISAKDKQEIEKLRQQLQQIRQEGKVLKEQLKESRGESKAPLTEAQKTQIKAQREKVKSVYTAASAIAAKYKTPLESIKADISDDRTKWKADIEAILAKHGVKAEAAKKGRHKKRSGAHMQYAHLLRPAQFILWDGAEKKVRKAAKAESATVYPNPTTTTNTIAYKVARQGNVRIVLLDEKGTTVRTLLNENKTPGKYTLEANLRDLPNATYYYKIETAAGSETIRFIKR